MREPDEAGVDGLHAEFGVLLVPDELLGERQASTTEFDRPRDAGPSRLKLLLLPGEIGLAHRPSPFGPALSRGVLRPPGANVVAKFDILSRKGEFHRPLASRPPDGACCW